ncbi:MAG TPA: hypothetical protein VIK89_07950 [Cytophagaceae bacterium]
MEVLFTNLYIKLFSGSEVNILDISKVLLRKGFQITVFTFQKGDPLLTHFDECGINVTCNIQDIQGKHFDIIWAQHYVVLNIVLLSEVKYDKIIFSSLSPFESFEFPPSYCNKLSLVLANSHETRAQLISNGVDSKKIKLFPNSVDLYYYNQSKPISSIKKIACISNHPPEEVLQLKTLLKEDQTIDFFGINGDSFQLVTPELLLAYDCIITIGKTVQYSMALNIPVYCYDHFGGPGWLTRDNLDLAFEKNFSGRGFNQKNSEEIYSEIFENTIHPDHLSLLHNFCIDHCNLEKNVSEVLNEAKPVSKITSDEIKVDSLLFKRVFDQKIAYEKHAEELEKLKSLLENTNSENRNIILQLQQEINLYRENNEALQSKNTRLNEVFNRIQNEITALYSEVSILQNQLHQIEQSKFWKLRNFYWKYLKRKKG